MHVEHRFPLLQAAQRQSGNAQYNGSFIYVGRGGGEPLQNLCPPALRLLCWLPAGAGASVKPAPELGINV